MTIVSVIVPVYREGATINPIIDHLHAGLSPEDEILVVDGAMELDTLHQLRSPRPCRVASLPGRAVQMNRGAEQARGDILLFVHADTLLPDGWRDMIVQALSDPRVVAGAFELRIHHPALWFRIIERTANLRTRFTRVPYGDQALFFRTDYFRSLRGFPEISIMEDVAIMAGIRRRGDRIALVKHPVHTSARRWEKEGVVWGTLRNWGLRILYHLGVDPGILVRFYRRHA
ncbi:TIGR04283 family arsenosugar biosynthesis glycosyltransferase [Desulfoplanes formicivorans]|uniref:Glycosyl transferase n=1 Tax=Desulfoplanes formicivorans TaxID=1592317 RepID=A0A194AKB6_9BACT|nr:TIGR04283 family arsenosugar biosynthesis glycosyltransferase [Desulfoplanes formicivorans]GAU09758.1 glycosyl transferase [Desulfoplanes formicivorans]